MDPTPKIILNSEQGATDPTPKENLVIDRYILIHPDGSHPKENYGWEMRRKGKSKIELTLTFDLDLKVVSPS